MVEKIVPIFKGAYRFISSHKGFIVFCFLKLIVAALNFLITIIIVRKVSVEGFGTYVLVLMAVGLAVTFGFSWSSSSILYYGSSEKEKSGSMNKVFWARNVILMLSLMAVTTVFFITSNWLNVYLGENLFALVLVWVYVKAAEDFLTHYFLASKRQILCNVMLITARILFILLLLFVSFDVKKLVLINIICDMSVLAYMFFISRNDIGKFEFDRNIFREILAFSLWQLIGFSGLYIINFGDTLVIKYFMTTREVGIYNSAYRIFNGIAGLSYVISSYYAASASGYLLRNDKAALRLFFYRERPIILGTSLLLNIIVIIFAKPLILILYGKNYLESIWILRALMVGCIFKYADVFYIMYCNLSQKYRLIQSMNITQSIMNFLLDIVFIKWFGLIGPAIATSLSIALTAFCTFAYCEGSIASISGYNSFFRLYFWKQKMAQLATGLKVSNPAEHDEASIGNRNSCCRK